MLSTFQFKTDLIKAVGPVKVNSSSSGLQSVVIHDGLLEWIYCECNVWHQKSWHFPWCIIILRKIYECNRLCKTRNYHSPSSDITIQPWWWGQLNSGGYKAGLRESSFYSRLGDTWQQYFSSSSYWKGIIRSNKFTHDSKVNLCAFLCWGYNKFYYFFNV